MARKPNQPALAGPSRRGKRPSREYSIPADRNETILNIDARKVRLTNLRKPFWPELGITKGDLPSLLWLINLGCIDLNPWYARCDDLRRPDYLHFDLDPVEPAGFDKVLETAAILHRSLDDLRMPNLAKTSGSKGMHVYVPIVRGPTQKEVWTFAKALAKNLGQLYPDIITAEYRVGKRPAGRVLVDYNQNAWGRTLASVYSVRPTPRATVSAPVTWAEVKKGFRLEDFRMDNMPERVRRRGDLWRSLFSEEGRFALAPLLNV
jgi:bifunctional non-homologous end joining protein LigD